MDFLHYALIQTIKGDKEGRGRSTCFVDDEIFFLCEGYWLPSVTTIEAFRSMPDQRCFFLAGVLGWLRRSIAMIKSKQIFAELAGDYLGGKMSEQLENPNPTARSILPQHRLRTEPSCDSQVRGLANICVHR